MADLWIVNASPIIALAGVGLHELLPKLAVRIVIPASVQREILAGDPADPARQLLEGGWGERAPDPPAQAAVAAWALGAGESSVIALGLTYPGCDVVLDDAQARRCAKSLGLSVRGTIGTLLLAKRKGVLSAIREPLQRMKDAGFFIDMVLMAEALKLAGE